MIHFTRREKHVMEQIKKGKSSKEIASILNIKKETVWAYSKSILDKTGMQTKYELIIWLFENNQP